ncbi:hypothetical protein HK405_009578 [Cladochytrium tenue]|nr:hypothetical protein HK405_009578 [Cladochytrium tenue]
MTVRADYAIQNAFAFDPTIPEHEPMPTPAATPGSERSRAAVTRCEAKAERVRTSLAFLQAAAAELRPRLTAIRARLLRDREALVERRVRVLQAAVEVVRCGVLSAAPDTAGPSASSDEWSRLDPLLIIPVEDDADASLDPDRPAPAPTRYIPTIPVNTEGLPSYEP